MFIRFPNAIFTGMRDGSIAEPQMEAAAAAMVTSAVINKFVGDRNCDNVSDNVNPNYLVPTGTHSWCAGTGLSERLHSLRLDNTTVGVGRTGIDNSETSIGVPCRTFGMLKHFEWSTLDQGKNAAGSLLWSCDAHAQLSKELFHKVINENALDAYSMPPTCVIAGMFKQWRGSLEFKFDIIASQFHTGRLLCAYIPGFYGDASNITLAQARNSPCIEFSLEDSTSFTFIVPFISDRVFWPRKYTGPHKYSEYAAPSKLVLFILNPLIPMESVVNKVVIVPYFRAGVDFEVSVPVQPSVGLSDNVASTLKTSQLIYPGPKSYPYKVSNSRKFLNSGYTILYEGTDALGTVAAFHAPERKLKKTEYYYGKAQHTTLQPYHEFTQADGSVVNAYVGFIVLWYNDSDKYNYGIPFPSGEEGERRADKVAKALRLGKTPEDVKNDLYVIIVKEGKSSSSNFNSLFFTPQYKVIDNDFEFLECGSPEMEDQRVVSANPMMPTSVLPSTSGGSFNFNESFTDLKDVARRYQLYGSAQIKLPKSYDSEEALVTFPVIPHGLDLDVSDSSSIFNVCRDGHIPLISSSYIYFRGSIRYKLVFSSDAVTLGGVKVWVQHHPDGDCLDHKIQVYPNISAEDSFQSHTYSSYVQPMHINSVIEFEVPFYQPGMYGLTRKAAASNSGEICQYYSLGNILIGAYAGILDKAIDFNVKVFYSIGDDFSFSTFRGFPATVFTDEVWPVGYSDWRKKQDSEECGSPQMEEASPEMFKSLMSYVVSPTVSSVKEEVVKQTQDLIKEEASRIHEKFHSAFNKSRRFILNVPTVTTAIGNLAHVVANPTPKTIGIAIANIIVAILSQTIEFSIKIIKAVVDVVKQYWYKFTSDDTCGVPEMADDDKSVRSLQALIFSVVCSMAGVTCIGPSKFPDILRNINSAVSLYNNSIRLVENSADLISYCINYVTSKLNPEAALAAKLMNDVPTIQQWYKECCYLLDVRNKNCYLYDNNMVSRVFDACIIGNLLVSSGLSKSHPGGKVVFDTHKEIKKLQNDLVERGQHPDVRFETWPLWLYGGPGIGKSFLVDKLANDLLRSVGVKQAGSMIYTIPAGAKYWSGCKTPACLVSDDFLQMLGTKREEEIANLFTICSTSVLNPPMAAVEDKERRINPFLYIMCSNTEYPDVSTVCASPAAVYRRRKYLLHAEIVPEYQLENFKDCNHIPREVLTKYEHLRFRYRLDVKDPGSAYSDWHTYSEILAVLSNDFKVHYENERLNFVKRMQNMYSLDPNFDEDNIFSELPELERQNLSLSKQIELYREQIQNKIDEFNDPQREPEVWDYLRKCPPLWKKLRGKPQMGNDDGLDLNLPVFSAIKSACVEQNSRDTDVTLMEELAGVSEPAVPVFSTPLQDNYPELGKSMDSFINSLAKFDRNNKLFKPSSMKADVFSAFYGSLSSPESSIVEIRIQDRLNTLFCLNSIEIETFYTKSVKRIQEVGNFDVFEILKFFLCFTNGHQVVANVIFDCEMDDLCSLDIDPAYEQYSLTPEAKSDSVSYHNVIKKNTLRRALASHELEKPSVICALLFEFVIKKFSQKYSYLFENCNVTYDFSVAKVISNCEILMAACEKNSNTANLQLSFRRLIKIHCSLLALLHICNTYFINKHHICHNYQSLNTVRTRLDCASFCADRRLLEVGDIEFKHCTYEQCIYNNPMYYYYLALGAVGCGKITNVRHDSLGRAMLVPREFTDVIRCLRKRTEQRCETWLYRLGRYLKHIFFHVIPDALSGIYNALIYQLPRVLIIFGLSSALMGGAYLLGCGQEDHAAGIKQGNYFKIDAPKVALKPKVPISSKSFGKAQMSSSNRQVLASMIENNTVLLYAAWVENGTPYTRSCRNLMLKGRAMLVLRHYLEEYKYLVEKFPDTKFFLFFYKPKSLEVCKINITWQELIKNIAWCGSDVSHNTSNYGIVDLPNFVPQFKNIVKRFACQAEHNNAPSLGDLYVVGGESSFSVPIEVKKSFKVIESPTSTAVYLDRVYKYNRQYKGLCGSVLVGQNLGSGLGAILGLHVAGNEASGVGYAEPVYREMFESFFEANPQVDVMPLLSDEDIKPEVELDSNIMMYGCVPPKFAHKESGVSKIIPSLLHGTVYPVKTEVNPLRPNDPRQPPGSHPLRDGCNKHGSGDVRVFDADMVQEVSTHLADRMQQIVRPVRAEVKPLTLQQAVCGDVDVPYFESLNWKSSEGFPLSSHRPKTAHDKKWLFELSEGQFGYKLEKLADPLEKQLRLRDMCFEKGVKPPTVYIDCLKDYRLSPEKCREPGKTRIFSVAPVQCSIDVRMHLNDFCASIKNSRIRNSIGIGINPDSLEWTELVHYLFEVGNKIITLDYSNYGPCLMSQLVSASNDVITEWHQYHGASPTHVNRVKWLLDCDILNPVHLCANVLYQTVNGIASGSPLTGECNSIPNLMYIRLTYLEIMKENFPEFATMSHFDAFVRIVVYGDDLIMSVDDMIAPMFNSITIRDYLAKHGIKVTPAQKNSEMVPYTSIYEATFLKRSFKEHPYRRDVWLAPIEKQSIEECINWVHASDNPQESLLEVCRASLDLAYSQGPEYYDQHYNKIKRALNSLNLVIEYKSWHQRDQIIFGESAPSEPPNSFKIKLPWTYALSEHTLDL
nr:MAG: polyprotein [Hangzhou recilia dorsalis iflavirus 2]